MAYIVGYVTRKEREELQRRGWQVEPAKEYNLVGKHAHALLAGPKKGDEAVVIFVDSSVFEVMNGPDWDKGVELCPECGEPAHVHYCPKPADISKEAWQLMTDAERLALEELVGHDMDRCARHHNHSCPDCHPMPEDAEER